MDYHKQAQDFLDDCGIAFSAVLIGSDCPKFCEDAQKNSFMDQVDMYPRKSHIHGKHYRCTFVRNGSSPSMPAKYSLVIDFYNSYADEEENCFTFGNVGGTWITGKENCYWDKYRVNGKYPGVPRLFLQGNRKRLVPKSYDVLTCIQKSPIGTFEDFCGDFSYDMDSRKAEQVYHAVAEEYRRVAAFFTTLELERLLEI